MICFPEGILLNLGVRGAAQSELLAYVTKKKQVHRVTLTPHQPEH
jgi:hypothetical protein